MAAVVFGTAGLINGRKVSLKVQRQRQTLVNNETNWELQSVLINALIEMIADIRQHSRNDHLWEVLDRVSLEECYYCHLQWECAIMRIFLLTHERHNKKSSFLWEILWHSDTDYYHCRYVLQQYKIMKVPFFTFFFWYQFRHISQHSLHFHLFQPCCRHGSNVCLSVCLLVHHFGLKYLHNCWMNWHRHLSHGAFQALISGPHWSE